MDNKFTIITMDQAYAFFAILGEDSVQYRYKGNLSWYYVKSWEQLELMKRVHGNQKTEFRTLTKNIFW